MGKNFKPKNQQGGQHAGQFEKIPGTAIRTLKGGIPVRVVHASGKEYSPNDIKGVWGHLEKLNRGGQAGKGQSKGQRKGTGKGVIKTQVKQVKGQGRTQGKGQANGQAKGHPKGQRKGGGKGQMQFQAPQKKQKGGGKGQVQFQKPQKNGKGGGKAKGGKAVQAPVKFKKGGFAATMMVKKKNLKNGKGAGKGGKGRKGQKKKKLTEEQLAALKEKQAERHAEKIEKEMRMLVSDTYYTGEVVSSGKFFCWVLPQSPPLPASVLPELKKMNDEFRAKAAQNTDGKKARPFANGCEGNVVYVARADVEEEALNPREGTAVKFKLYTDSKGVGGCEVISA